MYVRGYLQGSENGRVVTIALSQCVSNIITFFSKKPVALFTKILTIEHCRKCKTKIKKSFTKILTIILSIKIVLTLGVKF